MKLRYLGHSCFALVSRAGATVVTDPYGGIGLPFPRGVHADAVTVSHSHYDHCNVGAVKGDFRVFDEEGNFRVGDIAFSSFRCFHDDVGGRKRGLNLVFTFEIDGVKVCHLGDVGEPFSPSFEKRVGKIDVLLLPVGGVYTVDASGAKQYADGLAPAIVVPMHYKVEGLNIGLDGVRPFLDRFPKQNIFFEKGEIELSEPFEKNQKIIVMERI